MGVDLKSPPPKRDDLVRVLPAGETCPLPASAELTLEDGTTLRVAGALPRDLPVGYHKLRALRDEAVTHLLVTPGRCFLPPGLRAWGWAVQLYAARSLRSWGIGDFADLRELARWSRQTLHADFLLLNPVGAPLPLCPQEPSPYFPSSRRFRNPLYLRVEEVPGAEPGGRELAALAAAGRALNEGRLIDRDAVFRLKMAALEKIFRRFGGAPEFEQFCGEQGEALREFATFCVLAETHRSGWRQWPAPFRDPRAAAVRRFAAEHEARLRFHAWLQWLLDRQLARAGCDLALMLDLPIGVNPDGADAWAWQDVLAGDVTVGVPPDEYNTLGQDWGLPPFIPHKLRAAGYEPFRQTVRAMLRHARGLRIDHVMGLFRLFWIPRGASPREGAFVRYRADELLAILAIESQRAKAVIVGEDLGTVEPGVRATLRRHNVLSYRLLWFETAPPRRYPRAALAAVTTHDLFTIAGLWTGSDLVEQERLKLQPNVAGTKRILSQLQRRLGLDPAAPVEEAIVRTHRLLAQAPCALLTATLDDALAVTERPNMPGTTTQRPNWRLALPQPLEQMRRNPLVRRVARALARRRAGPAARRRRDHS
jgi:4-alpha-glucanotransferase